MNGNLSCSAMTAPTTNGAGQPQPAFGLNRALLLALGAGAHTIAEATTANIAAWLGARPPVAWLPGESLLAGAQGQMPATVTTALDALAAEPLDVALKRAGYDVRHRDELHLWLLIEIPTAQSGNQPQSTETVIALLELMTQWAWTRLRVQTTFHALVLAEPDAEAEVSALIAGLEQGGITPMHLAGPVNQGHVRLETTHWQSQTAIGLAALICGAFPSHAISATAHAPVRAIAACAWQAPRALLRRWLGLRSTLEALGKVSTGIVAVPEVARPLAANATQWPDATRLEQDLAGSVRAKLEAGVWRDLQVTWPRLADVHAIVESHAEQIRTQQHARLHSARLAWLDREMDAWHTQLEMLRDSLLRPDKGLPQLERYDLALSELDRRITEDLAAVDQALDTIEQRRVAAANATKSAFLELDDLQTKIPPYSGRGLLVAALQPWMWPIWPWAFKVLLARVGQTVLDAQAEELRLGWQEENWLILRQLSLGIAQDLRRRRTATARLREHLNDLANWLEVEIANVETLVPSPWNASALESFWQTTSTAGAALHTAPLPADRPLTEWCEAPVAQLGEQLLAGYAQHWDSMAAWTPLTFLVQAFVQGAPTASAGLPPGLVTWLDEWVTSTRPLWPPTLLAPQGPPRGWLLTASNDAADAGALAGALQTSEVEAQYSPAIAPIDGLVVVRWASIDAACDEEPQA